jgi:hypothetical protein
MRAGERLPADWVRAMTSTTVLPQHAALVIDGALALARARHPRGDVAAASLAGLALVRNTVAEHAGYAAMRQYDDWLVEQLAERRRRRPAAAAAVVELPAPAGAPWRPVQIVREAVQSCLLMNGHAPGNTLLLAASEALLDGVIADVGLPDRDSLVTALDARPERDGDETGEMRTVLLQ